MTERQLTQRFVKQLKKEYPKYHWDKLGDTFGGHKKTADMVNCINGKYVAIEFKKGMGRLTDGQLQSLNEVIEAGGIYLVGYFSEDGKELHFYDLILKYKKGRYDGIENWIKSLIC